MTLTPTSEQLHVLSLVRESQDNILISALAGAAKTTTLVLIAEALRAHPMLFLAFNKRIQLEMQERLPGNCTAMTLNGIGHKVWMQAIGKRLTVDTAKNYNLLQAAIEELPGEQRSEAYGIMSETLRAIERGKMCGYLPDGRFRDAKPLMGDDEFFASLEEEPSQLQESLIRKVTIESALLSLKGIIDFNDQILMPTCFFGTFPKFPVVGVDEAQDLSALNHVMLRKIVRTSRLIAVGDANQSIYGFRGAHEDSMELLAQTFFMKRAELTISFRCPVAVVKAARFRAPAMQWPEWAKEGNVTTLSEWSVENIPLNATILCRNNAPLFSCAIALLKNGRYPELVGNDIGKNLIKLMKKLGDPGMPAEEAHGAIDQWKEGKLSRARDKDKFADQAACMHIFVEQGKTLADAIAYAEHLLRQSGTVKLMTGHKSKGLEWPEVFILDQQLINLRHTQERNLLYVMITRAKESLTYITMEGFQGE